MTTLRWRLLRDEARSGPENMARDHALAAFLEQGEGVLRLYAWSDPTVSFGRNEAAAAEYDRSEGEARGIGFVRRPTGGRAVLHHREVTYAVAVPGRALGGPRDAYAAIHRGLVRGLRSLGVAAEVREDGVVAGLDQGPCFRLPAPGEVTARGRKLVGSAQVRLEGALLQHGSVIVSGNQRLLASLRGEDPASMDDPSTVAGVLDRDVAAEEVADALASGCHLAWGGDWAEGGYRDRELEEVERLRLERYGRDEWTWRR